jgi:putative spermidine/putrescine transport system permease protein
MVRRIFLSAFLVGGYIFLLAPVLIVVITSFNADSALSFPPVHFTFNWYRRIKPTFFDALLVSVIVATATALLSITFGVPAGLALSRGRFPGKSLLNALCLSPLMVPALVTGVALYQYSLILWDWTGLGMGGTIFGLVTGHLTFGIPFVIRAVIAGHARFDRALEEAAQNLGASPLITFWRVTVPVLRPSIISGGIFAFLMSMDEVPIALFMGGGNSTTLPIRIFTAIEFDFGGDVMAISALIVLVSVALMLVLDRIVELGQFFGSKQ